MVPAGNTSIVISPWLIIVIRLARRSAETPGPGRFLFQEVTIRQRRATACARTSDGAAKLPAAAVARTRRRVVMVIIRSERCGGRLKSA